MGIYIGLNLDVEKTSKEEWEDVFYKVGEFVGKTPLMELKNHNILGQDIYVYTKSKIENDKYIKIDADSKTYRGGESFKLYKDFDVYKKDIDTSYNGIVPIWNRKTQGASYHKYVLATALVLEYFLKHKVEINGDITKEQLEESKKIVKDLYDLNITETSATKSITEKDSCIDFFMNLFGIIEDDVNYDVMKDEYYMLKRLEMISMYDLKNKGIDVEDINNEDLKLEIFKLSKKGSYIWNLETLNKIVDSDNRELLKKYYILLALDLYSGEVFDECEIKFFPDDKVKDLRKPKKLISKLLTYY